jgi:hypothetical protein
MKRLGARVAHADMDTNATVRKTFGLDPCYGESTWYPLDFSPVRMSRGIQNSLMPSPFPWDSPRPGVLRTWGHPNGGGLPNPRSKMYDPRFGHVRTLPET